MRFDLARSAVQRRRFSLDHRPPLGGLTEPNRFRHQIYTGAAPTAPWQCLQAPARPKVGSPEFHRRMSRVGEALRVADVGAIFLVHGTFAGIDALGVLAELARWYPAGRDSIGRIAKRMVDALAGDAGNYTTRYAESFEESIGGAGESIPVRPFHWSSENHHLGRADAAVRLIDEIAALELPPRRRILIWGHSHAGNVFALMSNLLAGDAQSIECFFAAARLYYRVPFTGLVDIPVWERVRHLLAHDARRLAQRPIDMVTFGTPIRYGWDRRGHGGLLHFIHHRPLSGMPPHLAPFPPRLDDVFQAAGGDYLQQIGIAGTNTAPSVLAWRAFTADRNLNELLQPGLSPRDLVDRLQLGMRVPESGATLLVDYGPADGNLAAHLAGHAVYTRHEWLLFHAEEVVQRLYHAVA
ncbi:MAG TPA: hypothetical protein VMV69_01710 [Pirellulales bacterium]|nr:hypothetical protein [Pirellulales bacterium]